MNRRLRAALVIARHQALETLLAPGLYVTLALGMLVGLALTAGFASSVDSAGFNAAGNPLYDVIDRAIVALFGVSFEAKLFAEGPFAVALPASFLPVFLFLGISSVFRFGQEKSAGAVELLTYGPADGTSYFSAMFVTQAVLTLGAIGIISLFLWVSAAVGNLVLGPTFLLLIPVLFVLSLSVYAYGILLSVVSSNATAALASFLGVAALFAAVAVGSLAAASDSLHTVLSVATSIVQWLSPLYYASLCIRTAQVGSAAGSLAGIFLQVALAALLLGASHLAIGRRGVRA